MSRWIVAEDGRATFAVAGLVAVVWQDGPWCWQVAEQRGESWDRVLALRAAREALYASLSLVPEAQAGSGARPPAGAGVGA